MRVPFVTHVCSSAFYVLFFKLYCDKFLVMERNLETVSVPYSSCRSVFSMLPGARKNIYNSVNGLALRELGQGVALQYNNTMRRLDVMWPNQCDTFSDSLWESPIFASAFCPSTPYENLLACANEDGRVTLWKINNYSPKLISSTVTHDNAVFDVTWHPKDRKIVTVSGDNSAVLWDTTSSSVTKVIEYLGHDQTVKTAAFNQESPDTLGTGDRKGAIFLWDTRTGRCENKISPAHERLVLSYRGKPRVSRSSVTGLGFFDNYLLSVSAGSSKIKLWDQRKYYTARTQKPQPVLEFSYKNMDSVDGFSHLLLDHKRQKVYFNCINSSIYCYHLSSLGPQPAKIFTGLLNNSFYVKSSISPDGNFLISGSTTDRAYIWTTKYTDNDQHLPVRVLKTNAKEVNSVSWSSTVSDQFLIVTCGESEPFCIWGIPAQNLNEKVLHSKDSELLSECVHDVVRSSCSVPTRRVTDTPKHSVVSHGKFKQKVAVCPFLERQSKRSLREMFDNCTPGDQSKKHKVRCVLSSKQLFSGVDMKQTEHTTSSSALSPNPFCEESDFDSLFSVKHESSNVSATDSTRNDNVVFSPTSNLPNYVIDGTSPSHVCKPRRKENTDWLTKLRNEKTSLGNIRSKSVVNSNLRKQHEHFKKNFQKQHGNILKFFRVLGKSGDDRLKSLQGNPEDSEIKPI